MISLEAHNVYFIGIGGIGMSALARYFHSTGRRVSGYDRTATELTRKLEQQGISIIYDDAVEHLPKDSDLVIYTPAVPSTHPQLQWFRDRDYPVRKRAEVLGAVCNSMRGLAVAGSHGKTSTGTILAHILQTAGYDAAAFLGGIALNYESNYLPGKTWCVAEADEYDRSFHQLHPQAAVITSVDTDHLDVYGNLDSIRAAFASFAGQVDDLLITHVTVPELITTAAGPGCDTFTYGLVPEADYHTVSLKAGDGMYRYDVATPNEVIHGIELKGGGRHNVENSVGAMALASRIGVEHEAIRTAIRTYKGVQRRFEVHIERDDLVYIDDYAHHPREIEVTLETARELFPGRSLTVVFQPHLYSRTRDLAEGLAEALSKADRILLLDIYPAREEPIAGVSSGVIYNLLKNSVQRVTKNQVLTRLEADRPELLLTMGAGDIDTLVKPICEMFRDR